MLDRPRAPSGSKAPSPAAAPASAPPAAAPPASPAIAAPSAAPPAAAAPSAALRFTATPIAGAWLVEGVRRGDARGFFARQFCATEFGARGLETGFAQVNHSRSAQRGTLRGMHYQLPPAAEVKLVRCIRGALFDAIIDLRPDSPSFGQWFGARLEAETGRMLYVPRGCAHGFLTLEDDTEALYLVSDPYAPAQERGLRFDDPRFGIEWPAEAKTGDSGRIGGIGGIGGIREISEKDRGWPAFDPAWHGIESLRGLLPTPPTT